MTRDDLPGKEFERRVADEYRALGYKVVPNTRPGGKQTDLLAQRLIPGAPMTKLAIECKDHSDPVGNDHVLAFVHHVVAHRTSNRISAGVMVSASGFTADGREAAAGHPYIALLSWEELTADLVDVRRPLAAVVKAYEESGAGEHYLPLSTESLSWSTLGPSNGEEPSLSDVLDRWTEPNSTNSDGPSSLFVLGDFGAGKTTLLRNLQYDRSKAYLAQTDPRVPLFVPLRSFRDTLDLTTLLRTSFRDTYNQDLSSELLWQRLREGRFYVLLDGFDEMAERSDSSRRLDLFHKLFPVLRTPSRTIVTSRPGYFVGRGELEGLLKTLETQEDKVTEVTSKVEGGTNLPAGLLRRRLIARHRDVTERAHAGDWLPETKAGVFKLLPLDPERIMDFLGQYASELAAAGSSPLALMEFISRTYDLTDLASRPQLLTLIIDSVVVENLDPSDTDIQFGASGLYEIYTDTKLHIDLSKGRTREGGLSAQARRMLAEALAVHMYRENTLSVAFHEVLSEILPDNELLERELAKTDLSPDEIETDFATCSFVTLDGGGACRFIHKTFRGFFVARMLKERLHRDHPLFGEWIEREVLYFLGGFAPTEQKVGKQLWAKYSHAPSDAHVLRRNMLVAFLHTEPAHDSRRIANADIADAEFGRLTFRNARMSSVAWSECVVKQLELLRVNWQDVHLLRSRVVQLSCAESELDLEARDSTLESLRIDQGAKAQIAAFASSLDGVEINDGSLSLAAEGSKIGHLSAVRGTLTCACSDRVSIAGIDAHESRVRVDGDWKLDRLQAVRSTVALRCPRLDGGAWSLVESLATVSLERPRPRATPKGTSPGEVSSSVDSRSVLLPAGQATTALLNVGPCGLFGALDMASTELDLRSAPSVWGVVDAGKALSRFERGTAKGEAAGLRWGQLLLVTSDWYAREAFPGGRLSSVDRLRRFAEETPSGEDFESWGLLAELLATARAEFEAVMADDWGELSRP